MSLLTALCPVVYWRLLELLWVPGLKNKDKNCLLPPSATPVCPTAAPHSRDISQLPEEKKKKKKTSYQVNKDLGASQSELHPHIPTDILRQAADSSMQAYF